MVLSFYNTEKSMDDRFVYTKKILVNKFPLVIQVPSIIKSTLKVTWHESSMESPKEVPFSVLHTDNSLLRLARSINTEEYEHEEFITMISIDKLSTTTVFITISGISFEPINDIKQHYNSEDGVGFNTLLNDLDTKIDLLSNTEYDRSILIQKGYKSNNRYLEEIHDIPKSNNDTIVQLHNAPFIEDNLCIVDSHNNTLVKDVDFYCVDIDVCCSISICNKTVYKTLIIDKKISSNITISYTSIDTLVDNSTDLFKNMLSHVHDTFLKKNDLEHSKPFVELEKRLCALENANKESETRIYILDSEEKEHWYTFARFGLSIKEDQIRYGSQRFVIKNVPTGEFYEFDLIIDLEEQKEVFKIHTVESKAFSSIVPKLRIVYFDTDKVPYNGAVIQIAHTKNPNEKGDSILSISRTTIGTPGFELVGYKGKHVAPQDNNILLFDKEWIEEEEIAKQKIELLYGIEGVVVWKGNVPFRLMDNTIYQLVPILQDINNYSDKITEVVCSFLHSTGEIDVPIKCKSSTNCISCTGSFGGYIIHFYIFSYTENVVSIMLTKDEKVQYEDLVLTSVYLK